ncbi:unnamed protein product [Ceratitis capitata]|uniref:(Mediterranean fruit fly) hypothetical protein n=1 Tax=Ceratitis capitata TaxID=7213 RepID=A0A811UQU6_CERCA|nr:unnamed protein product [Ceratitis capitata]
MPPSTVLANRVCLYRYVMACMCVCVCVCGAVLSTLSSIALDCTVVHRFKHTHTRTQSKACACTSVPGRHNGGNTRTNMHTYISASDFARSLIRLSRARCSSLDVR